MDILLLHELVVDVLDDVRQVDRGAGDFGHTAEVLWAQRLEYKATPELLARTRSRILQTRVHHPFWWLSFAKPKPASFNVGKIGGKSRSLDLLVLAVSTANGPLV